MGSKRPLVVMTGAINNSGDFLIKERVLGLLKAQHPERPLVLLDRWKPLDTEALAVVNASEGLILAGGPALQKGFFPKVVPLTPDLDAIKVPIHLLGVGWKPDHGGPEDLDSYRFTDASLDLLRRAEASGAGISVRDFASLLALRRHGIQRVAMTGCPAFYPADRLGTLEPCFDPVRRVGFSLGVRFLKVPGMVDQTLKVAQALRKAFPDAEISVALHHALEARGDHKPEASYVEGHRSILKALEACDFKPVDISGSYEAMRDFYAGCDLHLGYRLHAHILSLTLGKPSLLIAEDGRGLSFQHVLGDSIVPGLTVDRRPSWPWKPGKPFVRGAQVDVAVGTLLDWERSAYYPSSRSAIEAINRTWPVMRAHLSAL